MTLLGTNSDTLNVEVEDNLEGLEPIKSKDTNELIQERLMRYIRQEGLVAGDRLPAQNKLARRLRVSLVSLREALRALEAVGILEGRVGSGWYVKPFSFDPIAKGLLYSIQFNKYVLADLNDIRVHLEVAFIEHAAKTLTEHDLDELDSLVHEMVSRARINQPWDKLDKEFHKKLFSKIRNQVFSQLMDVFWSMYIYLGTEIKPDEKVSEALTHQPIVDALRAGDVEQAKQKLRDSLKGAAKRMPDN
jgi:DNA-binding FadR family transcriptional regulator